MCVDTVCNHHLDPAVAYLERDYEHWYLLTDDDDEFGTAGFNPGEDQNGLSYNVVMDSRTKREPFYGNTIEEDLPTSQTPQPMFTLKIEHDYWADGAVWSCVQGPVLPWEYEDQPSARDANRSDNYVVDLVVWLTAHGMEVSENLRRSHDWILKRYEEERALWRKRDEEAARGGVVRPHRPSGVIAHVASGGPWVAAILDEAHEWETEREAAERVATYHRQPPLIATTALDADAEDV
jgi:hypothetical protein